jgi:hypothetical protein
VLGFIPVDRPRLAVAHDGSLAAIQEPTRITVIMLPSGEPFGVITTDAAHDATDVGWLGSPPRLLVLTRFAASTRARVVDPRAARLIAERQIDTPMQLRACVDDHALVSGASGTTILSCDNDELVVRPFRAREVPVHAGAAHTWFVVAAGASLLECDPIAVIAKRTWRLGPGATVTSVGGNERVLWRTTREAPNRIDVIPLITLGQPKRHVLPESIAQVAGHPRSDLLACLGAESGRIHVVDLGGTTPLRVLDTGPIERAEAIGLVGGTETSVLVSQQGRPTTLVPLAMPTWRNELVAWTRSGVVESFPLVPAIAQLARRLELADALSPALTLCYGAYLCGAPGVPPDDLAEVLGRRWPDEIRGAGRLAATGVLVFTNDWISLAPAHCRMLDEL